MFGNLRKQTENNHKTLSTFIFIFTKDLLFFFYSSCPGMDQDLMKLCFISHTGLLGVLISEWVGK